LEKLVRNVFAQSIKHSWKWPVKGFYYLTKKKEEGEQEEEEEKKPGTSGSCL
jgi:hypothetical protein